MHSNSSQRIDQHLLSLSGAIEHGLSREVHPAIIDCLPGTGRQRIKRGEWLFDWHSECCLPDRHVLQLCLQADPSTIQGLICIADKRDHIFMHLIESAAWNKGKNKLYCGVAGNLVAAACKLSFDLKYDGVVSFIPKTQLISHYENTLGAKLFGQNRMFIDTKEALILVKHYIRQTAL